MAGYGQYSYAITTLKPDGSEESTQVFFSDRELTEGQVVTIDLYGEAKITKILEPAGIGRAGKAHAVKVHRENP